jgi:hypothetical protein
MAPGSEMMADEKHVTAIVVAEVRNLTERSDFDHLVESVGRHGAMRMLADGLITAYVIEVPIKGAALLTAMSVTLCKEFIYGQVVFPVQEAPLDVIKTLALDTGGEFFPVENCSLCGKLAPFATTVRLRGEDGKRTESHGLYCPACAAGISDSPIEPAAITAEAAGETVTARA